VAITADILPNSNIMSISKLFAQFAVQDQEGTLIIFLRILLVILITDMVLIIITNRLVAKIDSSKDITVLIKLTFKISKELS